MFITSDMSIDEQLSEVAEADAEAALLWPWILTFFDDWGRAPASPRRIKAAVFPSIPTVTADKVEAALQLYARVGLIVLYEVDGKRYMAVPPDKWFKYQTHIRRDKRADDSGSQCPPPPDGSATKREPAREDAHVREGARDCAQEREGARSCTPSPTPSPSPSPTNVVVVNTRAGAESDEGAEEGSGEGDAPVRHLRFGPDVVEPSKRIPQEIRHTFIEVTGRDLMPGETQDVYEAMGIATTEQIVRAIRIGAQTFRPKYQGDEISSFRYFLPVVRRVVAEDAGQAPHRAGRQPPQRQKARDLSFLEQGA